MSRFSQTTCLLRDLKTLSNTNNITKNQHVLLFRFYKWCWGQVALECNLEAFDLMWVVAFMDVKYTNQSVQITVSTCQVAKRVYIYTKRRRQWVFCRLEVWLQCFELWDLQMILWSCTWMLGGFRVRIMLCKSKLRRGLVILKEVSWLL